jgi:hypothetical protein
VLEFAEEGDFTHVIRGGPWRYRDDAVLIEALKEGEDPATLTFTSVPIWAQFKDIPFYLLSKKLARDLGKKIGSYITIDNNSRGDICDKFLRARVRIDINQPLLRWTPLLDGITGEEVIVHIFYERLPRFCFSCGIIGHGEERCILPMELRSGGYGRELGVPPTHVEDPRRWFLPETTEQERRQLVPTLPWNQPASPTPSKIDNNTRQQAIIAYVAREVGKLSVEDPLTKGDNDSPKEGSSSSLPALAASTHPPETVVEASGEENLDTSTPPAKKGTWKRQVRGKDEEQSEPENTLTTQAIVLGAPRKRHENDDLTLHPQAKRVVMQVPSLEVCLGKEALQQLRNEEGTDRIGSRNVHCRGAFAMVESEQIESDSLEIVAESKNENNVIGREGAERLLLIESAQSTLEGQSTQKDRSNRDEGTGESNLNAEGDAGPQNAGSKSGTDEGAWQAQ